MAQDWKKIWLGVDEATESEYASAQQTVSMAAAGKISGQSADILIIDDVVSNNYSVNPKKLQVSLKEENEKLKEEIKLLKNIIRIGNINP